MRSYQEIRDSAGDGPAFSNGTECYAWTEIWCDTCRHDRGARDDSDPAGCPIFAVALIEQRTPAEWVEQPLRQITGRPEGELAPTLGDKYHCVEYVPDDDGDQDEPPPLSNPASRASSMRC